MQNIKKQLLNPSALEKFKREAVKALEIYQSDSRADSWQKQLKEAKKERDNVMAAIKAGIISPSTKKALEEAEESIDSLSRKIDSASKHR